MTAIPDTPQRRCSGWNNGVRCGEKAEYVLTVTCPCHGSFRHAACEKCTAAARSGSFRCTDGHRPNVVTAARSL